MLLKQTLFRAKEKEILVLMRASTRTQTITKTENCKSVFAAHPAPQVMGLSAPAQVQMIQCAPHAKVGPFQRRGAILINAAPVQHAHPTN